MKEALINKKPFVLAHWHGDELVLMQLIGRYRLATIASTSKDGEMMNTLIHLVGGRTTRGSSTRGGVQALKGLLRLVKEGYNSSFAVDGPKGPIYQVKPGIFELSRLMGAPIYYAGVACDRRWVAEKSWNKAYLPKPFSKVLIEWRGPLAPINKEIDPRSPDLANSLAEALHNAKSDCVKKIATSQT